MVDVDDTPTVGITMCSMVDGPLAQLNRLLGGEVLPGGLFYYFIGFFILILGGGKRGVMYGVG